MIVFYNMNRLVIDQATRNGSMPYYFGAGHLNLALMMDIVIGVVEFFWEFLVVEQLREN